MKAECKGCTTNSIEGKYCTVQLKMGDRICPCESCLIKMVCENACDEWMAYHDEVHKHEG